MIATEKIKRIRRLSGLWMSMYYMIRKAIQIHV